MRGTETNEMGHPSPIAESSVALSWFRGPVSAGGAGRAGQAGLGVTSLDVLLREDIVGVPLDDRGLAHPGIPDDEHLEQVAVHGLRFATVAQQQTVANHCKPLQAIEPDVGNRFKRVGTQRQKA